MSENALKFRPVKSAQETLGHRHHGVLGITAGRERVRRLFVYYVYPRHRKPGGDAKVFNDIVKFARAFAIYRMRTRHRKHDFIRIPIAHDTHHRTKKYCDEEDARVP